MEQVPLCQQGLGVHVTEEIHCGCVTGQTRYRYTNTMTCSIKSANASYVQEKKVHASKANEIVNV